MPELDVPFMEPEDIRSAARRLRRSAFGSSTPVPVRVEQLAFDYLYDEHGVEFLNDQPLDDADRGDVLGVTYPKQNRICVDAELAESGHRGRYRFTVAHEIGHWVLHRPLVLDDDTETPDPDAKFVTLHRDVFGRGDEEEGDDDSYSPVEYQANVFAIWLLLPDDALRREFRTRFGEPPFERDPDWDVPPDEDVRYLSRALAATPKDGHDSLENRFELSNTATAIALQERGYVPTE